MSNPDNYGASSITPEIMAYQHGVTDGIRRTLNVSKNVFLTPMELELLSLVLADYIDNVDPSLDTKLLHIFQKIKSLNNYFKGE